MKKTIKSLLGYLGCICITLAVTYYIDGTAGLLLTCALICALPLSVALTLVVRRFIRCEISVDKTLLVKGDGVVCTIRLSSKIFFPSPVIEVFASSTEHLKFDEAKIFKTSAAGGRPSVIKIPLTAKHSGAAQICIDKITLTDYLGVFSFTVALPEGEHCEKLSIYPDIPEVSVQTELLKTASAFSDSDEEEESDETAVGSTGMPGYDHRQYFPGDPIKKINWKLSSKRDIYMIRLDEKVCSAGQMFFLDAPADDGGEFSLTVRDNVIEGALAMMLMLVREGKEASFFRYDGGLWLKTDIHSSAEVYLLQEQFASFSPSDPKDIVPPEITAAGKTPICFTCASSEHSASAEAIVSKCPDSLIISAEIAALNDISPNLWTVTSEFDFKKKS